MQVKSVIYLDEMSDLETDQLPFHPLCDSLAPSSADPRLRQMQRETGI